MLSPGAALASLSTRESTWLSRGKGPSWPLNGVTLDVQRARESQEVLKALARELSGLGFRFIVPMLQDGHFAKAVFYTLNRRAIEAAPRPR